MPEVKEKTELLTDIDAIFQKALAPMKQSYQANADGPAGAVPAWKTAVLNSINGWDSQPKHGQVVEFQKDGTLKFLPAGAIMGQGGFLGAVEGPINNVWPTIPFGSIAVGGSVGRTVGELLDGLVPPRTADGKVNFANIAGKGGGMLVLSMWGSKLMSRTGVIIAVAMLGMQVLTDLLPLDKWVMSIVNWFRKLFGQSPMGQHPGQGQSFKQQVTEVRAQDVGLRADGAGSRGDLYAGIF